MLTYEAFCAECEQLVALSRRAARTDDSAVEWLWRHGARPHLVGNAFLASTASVREWFVDTHASDAARHTVAEDDAADHDAAGDIDDLLAQHEMDEAAISTAVQSDAPASETETVVCEFHIVYHVVYQTPALYFRASRLDGNPFRVDGHVNRLQLPGSRAALTFVSMEEHPVLGTPFWFLHPCETTAAMELLLKQSCESTDDARRQQQQAPYLLAWLSLVAPVTQINVVDLTRLAD